MCVVAVIYPGVRDRLPGNAVIMGVCHGDVLAVLKTRFTFPHNVSLKIMRQVQDFIICA